MSITQQLVHLDAVAQAELVARGELTAHELVEAARRRLELVDPELHAVVSVDFAAAHERVARGVVGRFAGVPLLLKDLLPYPGQRCTFGSRLFAGNVAASGSPFTDRLDAAGFVVIGMTATSELGLLGSTETLAHGVTHNPWDLALSAAGSSGGAAAAVAAGIVPLAHASDGGGSIRVPASVHGLFGFKPSRGRTASTGGMGGDFESLLSEGCVSRSVRDAAAFLAAVERPSELPPVGEVRGPSASRLRIAVVESSLLGTAPEPAVGRALADAAELLAALGHKVLPLASLEVDGPALADAFFSLAGGALVGLADQLAAMRGSPLGPEALEPFSLAVIEVARARGAHGQLVARGACTAAARAYAAATAGFDAVLTPTLAVAPWPLGWLAPTLPYDELIARTAHAVCYTPIQNVVGAPAMNVPLWWTPDGVPIGVQLAAAPGADALLLGLAYELEAARPWAGRWAPRSFVARAGR